MKVLHLNKLNEDLKRFVEMEHYYFLTKLFDFSKIEVQVSVVWSVMAAYLAVLSNNFMGISASIFMLLFAVMLIDYITGLAASKKEGLAFISKKGLKWVFKLGSYMIFLAVSMGLRKEIIMNGLEFLDVPMKLFHFTILIHVFYWETRSVDENLERLGYSFRVLKLMSWGLNIIKSIAKKKLEDEK